MNGRDSLDHLLFTCAVLGMVVTVVVLFGGDVLSAISAVLRGRRRK